MKQAEDEDHDNDDDLQQIHDSSPTIGLQLIRPKLQLGV